VNFFIILGAVSLLAAFNQLHQNGGFSSPNTQAMMVSFLINQRRDKHCEVCEGPTLLDLLASSEISRYKEFWKRSGFKEYRLIAHFGTYFNSPIPLVGECCPVVMETDEEEDEVEVGAVGGRPKVPFDDFSLRTAPLRRMRTNELGAAMSSNSTAGVIGLKRKG